MTKTTSLTSLANRHRRTAAPRQLIENRTVYASHNAELSIYDTYEAAERVRLDAGEVLYCGMMTGRKVMHGRNGYSRGFLPHESFVIAPGEYVEIDFPDACEETPTSCLTLEISRDTLRTVCDKLNQRSARPAEIGEWKPDESHLLHLLHTDATQHLLERIVGSFIDAEEDRDLVLEFGVNELVARMFRQQGRGFLLQCAQENPTQSGLVNVIAYVEQCLADTIDIDQLARIACMSRSKLYQQFKHCFGCGPMEYIQQRRLEKACNLIRNGKTITQTCYDVGYSNPSHFSRRFHQQYGMSPREYAARN